MTRTLDDYKVDVPEGTSGDVEVRRFTVERNSTEAMRLAFSGRGCPPGEYTALYRRGALWMSDTPAEYRDHYGAIFQIGRRGGRVLINGLGIGMVVKAALADPAVEHVDVVEIDPDVIKLVGPTYASDRCTIHEADAYTITWPSEARWSVAWHDVWLDLTTENLPLMTKLHRKYGRRVDWQGSWGKEFLLRHRRAERNAPWNRAGW